MDEEMTEILDKSDSEKEDEDVLFTQQVRK